MTVLHWLIARSELTSCPRQNYVKEGLVSVSQLIRRAKFTAFSHPGRGDDPSGYIYKSNNLFRKRLLRHVQMQKGKGSENDLPVEMDSNLQK